MNPKINKKQNIPDLSEYADEAIPFDDVIRKIGRMIPHSNRKPKSKIKPKPNSK